MDCRAGAMKDPTAQPVVYDIEVEQTERGVNLYIVPPQYVEVCAQREHLQADRWTLSVKQKSRIECAVMEGRAIYLTMHTQRQAQNAIRYFTQTFGGD